MKDVKRILDIYGIEDYLAKVFTLSCFDKEDNTQFYELKISDSLSVHVNMISNEPLIKSVIELADLLTQEKIGFFELTYKHEDLDQPYGYFAESYYYRPFVEDKYKDFATNVV